MKYIATIDEQNFVIEINGDNEILVDGQAHQVDFRSVGGQSVYSLILNGRSFEALVQSTPQGMQVLMRAQLYAVTVEDERQRRLRETSGSHLSDTGDFHLQSPMPGMVVAVPIEEGQEVQEGDLLVILESMKMQNELKSPRAGTVERVRVQGGDRVEQNQTLVTIS